MRDVLRALGLLIASVLLRAAAAATKAATALLTALEREPSRPAPTRTTGRPVLRILPGGLSTQLRSEVKHHG
ncbi:hypothetical protein D7V97_03355 [Corallococcus sp. CA053C]|uniref:hypothetical protein n=1 Tax=Corallococcus sp. CA053C TaxID=2316732 RepID=UPI000EA195A4|nr:hypothetical protein [Corallococcus sp. CA053C]RKH14331.1 hypothetical protein D7V97_03355 [Corallococcus sp. CA053C]